MPDGYLSTQFEKISDKAKSVADKLKAANERTRDQLESDVADARQGAEAAADRLRAKADDAGDAASSHRQQLRGKWQAHVADVHTRPDRARRPSRQCWSTTWIPAATPTPESGSWKDNG
jgi:hypothetical protein